LLSMPEQEAQSASAQGERPAMVGLEASEANAEKVATDDPISPKPVQLPTGTSLTDKSN
jgi:hypothetical protein